MSIVLIIIAIVVVTLLILLWYLSRAQSASDGSTAQSTQSVYIPLLTPAPAASMQLEGTRSISTGPECPKCPDFEPAKCTDVAPMQKTIDDLNARIARMNAETRHITGPTFDGQQSTFACGDKKIYVNRARYVGKGCAPNEITYDIKALCDGKSLCQFNIPNKQYPSCPSPQAFAAIYTCAP